MLRMSTASVTVFLVFLGTFPSRAGEAEEIAAFEAAIAELESELETEENPARVPVEAIQPSNETDLDEANAEIDRLKEVIGELWDRLKRERRNSHYNMGYVYKVCRQYKRAEQEFLKALELDPDDAGIHYNLGILYEDDLKNRIEARKHYERFLELAPHDPDAPTVREWLSLL